MRPRLMVAAVSAAVALSMSPVVAHAAPAPLTGVELNSPVENSVAVDAQFDAGDAYTVGLQALRQLRGEMWDLNPYFSTDGMDTSTRLRDIAAKYDLDSKEAYANAFTIDHSLTRISVQRAAEQPGGLSHIRPDGTSPWTATVNGDQSWSESLAGGTDLKGSILKSWGHGELRALNAAKGVSNSDNGHLHMMIDPKFKYYGFGQVYLRGSKYGNYSASQASEKPGTSTQMPAGEQRVWLYRSAAPNEKPTGLKEGVPGPLQDTTAPGGGLGGSSGELNSIIGIIFGVLSLLGVIAGIARQLGLIR